MFKPQSDSDSESVVQQNLNISTFYDLNSCLISCKMRSIIDWSQPVMHCCGGGLSLILLCSISNAPLIMEGPSNNVSSFLCPSPPHDVCCSLHICAVLWTTMEAEEAILWSVGLLGMDHQSAKCTSGCLLYQTNTYCRFSVFLPVSG